jgi:hypothetical protein
MATNFATNNGLLGWFMRPWAGLFGLPAERGAETAVYLATSHEVARVTGRHFKNKKETPTSLASRDEGAAVGIERETGGRLVACLELSELSAGRSKN